MPGLRYEVDPLDPRAPSRSVWEQLDDAERKRVVDSLPSELPRASPPEGDPHRLPKKGALESLEEYFRRRGRSVYLSSELPVYYPDEPVFAPDLLAVLDVETHPRERWVVAAEARGLDFVLEIHVSGERQKDLAHNVERYARLGIPEYFVFVPRRSRLIGHALLDEARYESVVPQGGLWASRVLGLNLAIEGDRLRFYHGNAPLPDAREWIDKLSTMVDEALSRAEEQEQRLRRYADKLRELGVDPEGLE